MSPLLPAPRLAEAYEVLEVVRQGGLSTTLRARHRGSGELRCIDVLRPAPGSVDELERRLDAEARPLMELRHPHLARLVDAAVGGAGEACLVREDHDGVTLRRLTGERRPSVPLAVEILRQAADTLAYLHSEGRRVACLAPEGLLLSADAEGRPRLVLADLGLARDWQEEAALTAAGLFVGRLRYTAPEQFEARGRQQAPSDVYALGLVAYELLTGRHPVAGDSASSLIAGHLFRPPLDFAESDPEGEVPEPLRRLVLSALAKAPAERPAAEVLAADLEFLAADLPGLDPAELRNWIDLRADRAAGTGGSQEAAHGAGSQATAADAESLQDWLDEARALAREERFVDARELVRKVLRQKPDHPDGLMLLASVEACIKIQVEESKSHQTATYQTQEQMPAAPQPSAAETSRFRTLGRSQPAAAGEGMQTLRIDPQQTQRLDLDAVAPSHAAGEQTSHQPSPADVPGSLMPGAPGSTERLDLPEGGEDHGRTKPLSPAVLGQLAEPDDQPEEESEDDLGESRTLPLGSSADVKDVREAPAQPLPGTVTMPMEQIREARQRSERGPTPPPPPPVPAPAAQTPSPQTPPHQAPPPQAAPPRTPPAAPRRPKSAGELGFGGAAQAPMAERRSRRGGRGKTSRGADPVRRRKRGGTGILIAAAVAASFVFVIGYALASGIDLRALIGFDDGADVVVTAADLPPVVADPGWLVLDAAPWAEIVQILDSLGEAVQLRIRHTPARYELPPGTYTVVLAAAGGEPETLELEVKSGEVTSVRPDLAPLGADEYFRLMGWQ